MALEFQYDERGVRELGRNLLRETDLVRGRVVAAGQVAIARVVRDRAKGSGLFTSRKGALLRSIRVATRAARRRGPGARWVRVVAGSYRGSGRAPHAYLVHDGHAKRGGGEVAGRPFLAQPAEQSVDEQLAAGAHAMAAALVRYSPRAGAR